MVKDREAWRAAIRGMTLKESGTAERQQQQQLGQELPKQPTSEAGGAPGGRAPRGTWVGAQASQRHSELEGAEWLHWWADHGVLQWRGWGVGRAMKRGKIGDGATLLPMASLACPPPPAWHMAGTLQEWLFSC